MKDQKDMDWELFEMLEGDLSPEEESELLEKIEGDAGLSADWDFMQMTQLDAPEVVYTGKSKLIKKDTALITFTAVQWRRTAAIAAMLALCYPAWQLFMPKTDSVDGLAGSATELVEPKATESEVVTPSVENEAVESLVADDNVAPKPIKSRKNPIQKMAPIVKDEMVIPEVKEQLVSLDPANSPIDIKTASTTLEPLPKANVMYNMQMLIPREETPTYKGIRHTVNAGLALAAAPFKNTKIKVQPADNQSIQIIYSSQQYNATAMVSLKPLK